MEKRYLESLEGRAGSIAFRTTIVENGGEPIPLQEAPRRRRLMYAGNRGFAAANNDGARGSFAEVLLFLNPDTELVSGTLRQVVEAMRASPDTGLVAVRQVTGDGSLWPSLHRFPSVRRSLAAVADTRRNHAVEPDSRKHQRQESKNCQ